ncbi:MAG TPA: hypothetical protein VFL85_05005 [Candidatus Saccharimonadales bacterium]|nr:hypothetical protein [Candidatus Saccharimonadales bacterium]
MSEYFPPSPFEGVPKNDSSPQIDPIIDADLWQIAHENFSHDEGTVLMQMSSRDIRVDTACWVLAQNPETVSKAVNLRSMYAVRSMDVATRNLDPSEPWDYHVHTLDPFWSRVDKAIVAFLRKSADKVRTDTEIHDRVIGDNNDIIYTEQNIAELNGRLISRRSYRNIRYTEPHHVVYSVLPEAEQTQT